MLYILAFTIIEIEIENLELANFEFLILRIKNS